MRDGTDAADCCGGSSLLVDTFGARAKPTMLMSIDRREASIGLRIYLLTVPSTKVAALSWSVEPKWTCKQVHLGQDEPSTYEGH